MHCNYNNEIFSKYEELTIGDVLQLPHSVVKINNVNQWHVQILNVQE